MGQWKRLSVGSHRSSSVGKVSGADGVIMSSYNLEGWSQLFKMSNGKYWLCQTLHQQSRVVGQMNQVVC